MRGITKGAEPSSLTEHRLKPHSDYDNYLDKPALRHALVTEQRGICCYCMQRIHNGPLTMKIEHWRCQSLYQAEQLNYRNLLGACLGGDGDGRPPHRQHCDTRKGDRDLRYNPASPTHHIETRVRYEPNGTIRSDDTVFNAELEDVLNLNLDWLKANRKAALDAVLDWWRYEKRRGPVPRERFVRERGRLSNGAGELEPFCQVTVWWLDQRLARMPA